MMKVEDTAGETAIAYADDFVDAAVRKIDDVFGAGHAKTNPGLVGAYLAACSKNLATVLQASLAAQEIEDMLADALDDAVDEMEEDMH